MDSERMVGVGGDVGDEAGGVDGDRGVGDGADSGDEDACGECGHADWRCAFYSSVSIGGLGQLG